MAGSALRVALVAPFGLRPKGTTRARVLPIARVLASRGAAVRVIVPPWDDPASAGSTVREGDLEIIQARLAASPVRALALVGQMLRLVRDCRPDVVHAFKPIGYSGLVGWLAAHGWLGRTLAVLDCDDLEGPQGWGGRLGTGPSSWMRGIQERHTVRAFRQATVASRWLAEFLAAHGLDPDRIFYLPQGWEAAHPAATPEAMDPRPTLLWYTRFTEAQPARVARLLAPLFAADPGLQLVVLGDEVGPGDQARAQRTLADAGLSGRVQWAPYRPGRLEALAARHHNLVAIYPFDDDLANRARAPTKLVELMALGTPVVAEAVGEAATYLREAAADCLAPPGDQDRFRGLVGRLLADAGLRNATGRQMRRAAEAWRWDHLAGGLLDWYRAMQQETLGLR